MFFIQIRQYLITVARSTFLFPVIAVLILAVLWAATYKFISIESDDAQRAAQVSSRALAETYEAQVIRAVREIDQTLKFVKYAYEREGNPEVLQEMKREGLLPLDLVLTISITDSRGNIIASSDTTPTPNIFDQEFFQNLIKKNDISIGPAQKNQDSEEWKLEFGHRLTAANGKFSGIVMAKVDAMYFVIDYENAKLGEKGLLGILNADGKFLVRRTGDVLFAGDQIHYTGKISGQSDTDPDVEILSSNWDEVRRYVSARRIYDFPLAVVVGLSVDEQMSTSRQNSHIYLWRGLVASVLLITIFSLLTRMSLQLERSRLQVAEEQIAHARRVEFLAYHDTLTNLPNRSLFSRLIAQSISQAHRHNRQLAVLFIDLDRFKYINDTMGHDAGDQLLKEVATRLKACLRDSDTVARLGGDEFIVLIPELEEKKYVNNVAKKLVSAIALPYILLGQECHVTISMGISIYPQDGLDEQALTKNADTAMYQAKQSGKNNFHFYS
jgi:diguanylate cyclase (GGDEF)-like protein